MSTSLNPLSAAANSSNSASVIPSTITFNGSSTYASSFQQVINRAVDTASLPLQLIQNDVSLLQSKQSALTSLGSTMNALQAAISNISSAAAGTPLATSSNPTAVGVTATGSALNGTYQIQVDSLGSNTTTISNNGLTTVTDPSTQDISNSTAFSLTVNGTSFNITSSGTTLDDLVSAINSSSHGVQATIVNVGSTATPDYRLSVTGLNLAPDSIQLNDGSQDLLNTLSTGSNATYQVNGQATVISSNSNVVTLSPGLLVTLQQTTTSPVTVSVKQSESALSSALSTFANAYNAAVAAVGQQRGENGGALVGDSLIFELGSVLGSIPTYTSSSSGSVGSLADLGFTLNSDGTLTFNSSTFNSATPADIQGFLGGTTTGGLLQTAFKSLNAFTDPAKGLIGNEYNTLGTQITADQTKITNAQATIATMQANLQKQLAAADAAIATIQSQTSYFQQLFTATYGGNSGANTVG